MSTSTIAIRHYADLERGEALTRALDGIFFEASGTKTFPSDAERAAFRHRWLGRYLDAAPELAFVGVAEDGEIAGYVVGALEDPAVGHRFADVGYFPLLAGLTARYPAHLHINLAPRFRGAGLGKRLVEAFCEAVRAVGAPGVHVVTGKGMRNVGFYNQVGFSEVCVFPWAGKELVMLARALAPD